MFDRNSIRVAVFGAALMTASVGWTQEQATTPEPPAPPSESSSSEATAPSTASQATVALDDQKIEKFADAYVAVQKIQTDAAGELDKTASDPAKQQQAAAAVETQMIAAVERTGLKLEEFNGIVQNMTADADLRARVVAKIRERMGG